MMFKLCCLLALLLLAAVAIAAPVEDVEEVHDVQTKKPPKVIDIVESGSEHKADGSYSFHYRGEDGSFREESAVLINPGTEDAYLEVTGSYSFFDSNGEEVVVNYKANDRGFVPEGSNINEAISLSAKHNSNLPAQPKTVVVDETLSH